MRNSDDQFYLVEEPHDPGELEVFTAISHKRAVVWLSANPARRRGAAAADRKQAERRLNVFIVLDGKWPTRATFRWANCAAVSSDFSQLAPIQNRWV
ncbi:hypothetical protein [Bradyrhizobium sp. ERR14]|uniref:hypothetical protein n=1 Tax=Bradyrhizobium sp. ERR14 TaxID=2663837 RepID=UPI001618C546|nr:hypothetical protein [Bradyrhizobium sp. ERR14]MBB4399052.1 hypothetical protein [Bradyrhizobium sp. ERR14]